MIKSKSNKQSSLKKKLRVLKIRLVSLLFFLELYNRVTIRK
jgi:hypothetical protein